MPYPLHKVPPGFLGLLNAKVSGQAPQAYAEQVVPTVETLDFYGLPNREMLDAGVGAQVGTFNQLWTVPSGEVWRVFGANIFTVLIAGTTPTQPVTSNVYVRAPNLGAWALNFRQVTLAELGALPLATDFTLIATAQFGFLLPAGWSIGAASNVTLTGVETYSVSARAMIERFPL